MTFQEEIAELQARIAAARAARDSAQAKGAQQPYFDACLRLQTLEQELEGLRQQGLRAFASQERFLRLEDTVAHARKRLRRRAA